MAIRSQEILNIFLGTMSILGILAGFIIKEYQILFWSISLAVLTIIIVGYYITGLEKKINFFTTKFKRIEESLNIYNRLNKLELKMQKKGEINLLDLLKIVAAILLAIVFYNAIKSLL